MPPLSFRWPVRVYIEDTDAGGIVFYANYLRFMERARTECIRYLGFPRIETIDPSVQFVVHSLQLRYHQPARLDDQLQISADIVQYGRTFMQFRQEVRNADTEILLVEGSVKVACIDQQTFKPKGLPAALLNAIKSRES
ncbi:tol-pal system-associated acyl-CoA thioesterase [Hahella sp. CCB-MM4]|uniref:tol-pal system-associated acyl-CoA thioesterase n=1 Tax=Hahella sp. (strain CCB-MM4) TaxID=1926491 RepID=UPI000B9C0CBC|nr:tol-pal system-associated acyl-CoA thioesterase [Hahella sp. CCB-MM4]OZG72109.1 tol-pal system-associated acyl-CoA thioesterase [Hahella sp. CCB-MM4]